MTSAAQHGSLKGLKVIELGQLIAGPFCGQLLADHGAEVIKVEAPGAGDPMRKWGQTAPLWWPVVSRNKKCITLNLREERGQNILREMVKGADFLLENFRPGTMEKWGLGYDELSKINPGLIMIRVSGFGQTGPYAKKAGYGSIGEAMGGMRNLAGDPATPPSRIGLSIGDSLAATYATLGALMALQHRHQTGRGQVVDSAIYEAVLAMTESVASEYAYNGFNRERTGSILPKVAPSNAYPTKDGDILIGANQDTVWRRLAEAMGVAELGEDPRYATHVARGERQQELDDMIADWTRDKTSAEVQALMDEYAIPAGKIFKAEDMFTDPHYQAREALVPFEHEELGKLSMQNTFPRLSETPGQVNWHGPNEMGSHNSEIYEGQLGLSEQELKDLKAEGII